MDFSFGNARLIGQKKAREKAQKILESGRIGHAYLISGGSGVGKTAFALAFAEYVNGISNLTQLGDAARSKKSSWFNHPDIHVFIPKPTMVSFAEVRERLEMLDKDPYEIIDFSQRPSLTDPSASKNRQAFYAIDYFRDEIRPATLLRPNEGDKTVVILTRVETMRKEAANAFLKNLEEPSERILFILTTEHFDSLLPTITSRCQHIPLSPLSDEEIKDGLIRVDGYSEEDAAYLSRVAGGNYAQTRFFDMESLQKRREDIVQFLRLSFSQDALGLSQMVQDWQSSNNIEGLISITTIMESYLRDIMVYRESGNDHLLINRDQIESIHKLVSALPEARVQDMMEELYAIRPLIYQNVSPKLIFTILALRYSSLIRGFSPVINESWQHLPAFVK
jgi:DNA polymerase-3 subunit delta'